MFSRKLNLLDFVRREMNFIQNKLLQAFRLTTSENLMYIETS